MTKRLPPIALLAVLSWLATIGVILWPALGVVLAGVPVITALWSLVSPRALTVALMTLPLAASGLATLAHHELRAPQALVERDGEQVAVLVVTEKTITATGRHVSASITDVDGEAVSGAPAMVFFEPLERRLPPGVTLGVSGRLMQGQRWDSRGWVVFAESIELVVEAPSVLSGADSLRESFLERARARGGDGGALLPGLALGDTEAVSESLEFDMRRSALAHLVAVSGANCALVVGMAVLVTSLLGGGVWWRVGAGVVSLVLFIVLVTPEPNVVRASVMATIVLLATALGRPQAGVVALSVTVWGLLLFEPWQAVEFAFVLSVAATAGILFGFLPAARTLSGLMPAPLAMVVALPLVAQLAVQPIIILLRPTLPIYGVFANALAAPFVPFVTLSGLAGSLLGPVLPAVASAMAWLGWFPATAIATIARAVGTLPQPELPWPHGALGVTLASLLSVGGFLLLSRKGAIPGASLAVASLVVSLALSHGPTILNRLAIPADWQIVQCDVGQGDALLVKTSAGVVGIDTGDDEKLLRRCVETVGVDRLSHLVLTHFDRDHVGQSGVYRSKVDTVLTGPPDNAQDVARLNELSEGGAAIVQVSEGDQVNLGDYRLRVLWPSKQNLGAPGNDSSVVVLLEPVGPSSGPSLLALGDLGEHAQSMLIARLPSRPVDVVKVSHHGSADQSEALYRQVGATVALIGVGRNNEYGHPTASTVGMLDTLGLVTLRTDRHGMTALMQDTDGIHVWNERDD